MPPERAQELVDQLRSWYKTGTMRQMDLAAQLGLKPGQLNEILGGRNRPTAEQILIIQDFLKESSMTKTPTFDRRPEPDDDDDDCGNMSEEPKTLAQAKARIARKQQEISLAQKRLTMQRTGKPAAPSGPIMPAERSSSSTGTYATPPAGSTNPAFTDGQNWTGKYQVRDFPPGADNPRDIAQHIAGLSTPALREHLRSAPKTEAEKLQQKAVFNELKARK
jgi:hypothetical protein